MQFPAVRYSKVFPSNGNYLISVAAAYELPLSAKVSNLIEQRTGNPYFFLGKRFQLHFQMRTLRDEPTFLGNGCVGRERLPSKTVTGRFKTSQWIEPSLTSASFISNDKVLLDARVGSSLLLQTIEPLLPKSLSLVPF